MIAPSVAVTAASCVLDYGNNRFYDGSATFIAAQYNSFSLYKATVNQTLAPRAQFNGTDSCSVPGTVCANDIAILILNKPEGRSKYGGLVGGFYNYESNDYGFNRLGAALITQLGYAENLGAGNRMSRTDSVGYLSFVNQAKFGSAMRDGSTGAPMIVNFGTRPRNTATFGYESQSNTVVGITNWKLRNENIKIQGGSRFNKNSEFPNKSNIQSLVDAYCCSVDQTMRQELCARRATC